MTDFCLKFTDQDTFNVVTRMVFNALAPSPLADDEPTPRQGLTLTGTHWFVDEIGLMYDTTDPESPVELEGYYANLRWNGGDTEPPSDIPGMEIVWRSDGADENGEHVPLPTWWSRIIA